MQTVFYKECSGPDTPAQNAVIAYNMIGGPKSIYWGCNAVQQTANVSDRIVIFGIFSKNFLFCIRSHGCLKYLGDVNDFTLNNISVPMRIGVLFFKFSSIGLSLIDL